MGSRPRENTKVTECPSLLMIQESSFWGFAPKWTGPHFASLLHGTFQLYKVVDRIFSIDVRENVFIGLDTKLTKHDVDDLALRISIRSGGRRRSVSGDCEDSNEKSRMESNETEEEDAHSRRVFYLICGSPSERDAWLAQLRKFLPRSRISVRSSSANSSSDESQERKSTSGTASDPGVTDRFWNDSSQASNSCDLKDAVKCDEVLKQGILLCSSLVPVSGKSSSTKYSHAAEGAERRQWQRRYFELTCRGSLECFNITMVACISLISPSAQILLDEAHATFANVQQVGNSRAKLRSRRSSDATTDDGTEAETEDEEKGSGDLADGRNNQADLDEIHTVDSSNSHTGFKGKNSLQREIAVYVSSRFLFNQSLAKSRSPGSRSFSEQKFYPFTITGEKLQDVPTFPYEKTSNFFSFFWRKVAFPSAVTAGAFSEDHRHLFTSRIRHYVDRCNASEEVEKKKRTESARIICKCWMMRKNASAFSVWKKRYCVLLSSKELVFYKNSMDGSRQGVVDLSQLGPESFLLRNYFQQECIEVKGKRRNFFIYPAEPNTTDISPDLMTWLRSFQDLASKPHQEANGQHSMQRYEGSSTTLSESSANSDRSLTGDETLAEARRAWEEQFSQRIDTVADDSAYPLSDSLKGQDSAGDFVESQATEKEDDRSTSLSGHGISVHPHLTSAIPYVLANNYHSRLKTFNTAGSDNANSRSSSFDGIANANAIIPRLGYNRSQSGGNIHEFYAIGTTGIKAEEVAGLSKIIERTNWQRMSGNVPIECMSLSPYSAKILAEQLTARPISPTGAARQRMSAPNAKVAQDDKS